MKNDIYKASEQMCVNADVFRAELSIRKQTPVEMELLIMINIYDQPDVESLVDDAPESNELCRTQKSSLRILRHSADTPSLND